MYHKEIKEAQFSLNDGFVIFLKDGNDFKSPFVAKLR